MEAFFVTISLVALSEIGDKTQLLSLLLAARYHRPLPIIGGIVIATLINHILAGVLGITIAKFIDASILRWVLGVGFIAMAVWILTIDKVDNAAGQIKEKVGIFVTTLVAFFLTEMGDKTQVATVALVVEYKSYFFTVIVGSTLGMMVANVPVVVLAKKLVKDSWMQQIRFVAAGIFILLGVLKVMNI